jgi:hypothetical protein
MQNAFNMNVNHDEAAVDQNMTTILKRVGKG